MKFTINIILKSTIYFNFTIYLKSTFRLLILNKPYILKLAINFKSTINIILKLIIYLKSTINLKSSIDLKINYLYYKSTIE